MMSSLYFSFKILIFNFHIIFSKTWRYSWCTHLLRPIMRRFTQLISHSIQAVQIDRLMLLFMLIPSKTPTTVCDTLNRAMLPEASFVFGQSQQDQILHTVLSVVTILSRTLIALSDHTLDVFFSDMTEKSPNGPLGLKLRGQGLDTAFTSPASSGLWEERVLCSGVWLPPKTALPKSFILDKYSRSLHWGQGQIGAFH